MLCPACKSPLLVLEFDRVEIDYCRQCGGVWLDSGEFESLAGESRAVYDATEQSDEKKVRCPKCLTTMDKAWFDTQKTIQVDQCRNGHGIWLDRGELTAVLGPGESGNRIRALLGGIFMNRVPDHKREME